MQLICWVNDAAQQKTFAPKNGGGCKKRKRPERVGAMKGFSDFLHASYMTRVAGRKFDLVRWKGPESETALQKVPEIIEIIAKIAFGKIPKSKEMLVKYAHLSPENYI